MRTVGQGSTQRPCGSHDSGQLRHPQAQGRVGLAGQASQVPPALHPDILVMAQLGRAVVPRVDRQVHQERGLPFRA